MKLINSRKEIEELIDDDAHESGHFFNLDEEEQHSSPCWEVKIDRKEKNAMIFLIDGEEKLLCPLSQLDSSFLTIEKISELIKLLRTGDYKTLRKTLGIKRR